MLPEKQPDSLFHPDTLEEQLPTLTLVNIPHPQIPNLYQRCYEYIEPWQWSPEVELVETGQWFFGPDRDEIQSF